MIIYLSGKITGKPYYHEDFFDAEIRLLKRGKVDDIVLNPVYLPEGLPREKYMPICFAMLEAADAIYMLNGWEESEGAKLEMAYAKYQGKKILFDNKDKKLIYESEV